MGKNLFKLRKINGYKRCTRSVKCEIKEEKREEKRHDEEKN